MYRQYVEVQNLFVKMAFIYWLQIQFEIKELI